MRGRFCRTIVLSTTWHLKREDDAKCGPPPKKKTKGGEKKREKEEKRRKKKADENRRRSYDKLCTQFNFVSFYQTVRIQLLPKHRIVRASCAQRTL